VIHMELNVVYNEDCLEGMNRIEDKSIDMILCDLPYGTTKCKWDTIIPFEPLWKQYNRIIKDNGAIVLTGSQPFTSKLILSNIDNFRYEIIWEKEQITNFVHIRKQIGKIHENICVFYKKQPTYNPQMRQGLLIKYSGSINNINSHNNITSGKRKIEKTDKRFPISIIKIQREKTKMHPTQKPVELFEYLIKTYTNEGDIVLDNCMGSGTTAIACMNTNRNFIGFEIDKRYYDIILERIKNHKPTIIQDSSPGLETWF
jgi:DNA modification methylase